MGTAMTRYGHIAWRVIAVVAFAGTAALAVTLTRAPVGGQSALWSDSALSTCAVSGLKAWIGLASSGSAGAGGGAQAPGGIIYTLEFTNVSARPCGLYGYPDVSAYAGTPEAGTQIGAAAAHDMSVRPHPVVLAPGATAHSVLRVAVAGSLRRTACGRVTAPELRVTLPESPRPAFVPVRLAACSNRGPAFMSVQPVQARAGSHRS
jgi:Protein of unknown function (DUF4232)